MASLDDQIETVQNNIIQFLIERENYITEYVTLPLFYEYIFHNTTDNTFRSILISAFMAHKIVKMVNSEELQLNKITLFAPFVAYVALTDTITSMLFYAIFFNNLYEGIFLSLSTGLLYYRYQSFLCAYFFHALYKLCKNTIFISRNKMRNQYSTRLDIVLQHKPPQSLNDRLLEIGNESGTFINNIFEPLRISFNVKM